MEQIAKDHKDYSFTTIAFHYPPTMPAEYFEKIGMNYVAKLKLGVLNDAHASKRITEAWLQVNFDLVRKYDELTGSAQ